MKLKMGSTPPPEQVSRPTGQPYAVRAQENFPRQRSGQLSSQGLRVVNLYVVPSANQTVMCDGIPVSV